MRHAWKVTIIMVSAALAMLVVLSCAGNRKVSNAPRKSNFLDLSESFDNPKGMDDVIAGRISLEEVSAFLSVSASDDRNVWAVASKGEVYHYDGSSWQEVGTLSLTPTNVFTLSPKEVWVLGHERESLFPNTVVY